MILFEGLHGVLSEIFPRWCAQVGPVANCEPSAAQAAGPPEDLAGSSAFAAELGGAVSAMLADAEAAAAAAGQGPEAACFESARVENERHRREALNWLESAPLTRVIVVRQAMEPLRQLMSAHLKLACAEWQPSQDAAVAVSIAAGRSGAEGRTCSVVEAASGRLEERARQQIASLMQVPHLWAHVIPDQDMNVRCRHFAFKLLSAAAALTQEALAVSHNAFPFRLFRLLDGAS